MAIQYDLFADGQPLQQEFDAWAHTPGGRHVLKAVYATVAPYGNRFRASGRRVSIKLAWELVRDRIGYIRWRAKRRGIELKEWKGYSLNNDFTAYTARHIEAHRPEWAGMFELRQVGKEKPKRQALVIPIKERAAVGE